MNCYLLVGGLSIRMGEPKAAADLGGASFEQRVVAAARGAFDEVIALDRAGGTPRAHMRTIFEEAHEGRAAAFGLDRALRDAGGARFWLLAVDYPLVTAGLLGELRRRFEASAAAMLVPWWDGVPQMLCAGYSAPVAPLVAAGLASGDYRLRRLLEIVAVEHLAEEDLRERHPGEPLMNVNDPADLERARRIHERVESPRS
jgi:molybdopterin-guanine dinucleotide biosynthesis protein A